MERSIQAVRMIQREEVVIVCLLFVIGIFFRLWLVTIAPQPFAFDQFEYETYAQRIYDHPQMLASHSYRPYPYPMFLALLYKLVGFGNHDAIFVVQAVIDSLVGVCIFIVIRESFHNKSVALIGQLLYSVNPFTSGFVGSLLAETLTGFFIVLTLLFGMLFVQKPTGAKGMVFGLFAGLAAETRIAAFIWAAIPIGLAIYLIPYKQRWILGFAVIGGVTVSLLYSLYVNFRDFHEINLATVDNFYAKEVFSGSIMEGLTPFTADYPPEVQFMYGEYYTEFHPERTARDRQAIANKYISQAWEVITKDPGKYVLMRIRKMWNVWQKQNIFPYFEPQYQAHRTITYAINVVLLVITVIGLVLMAVTKLSSAGRWLFITIIGSIVYATFSLSLTIAEGRLTIPFYPLLFIPASLAISWFVERLWKRRRIVTARE